MKDNEADKTERHFIWGGVVIICVFIICFSGCSVLMEAAK